MNFFPENSPEKKSIPTPPVREGFVRLYRGETNIDDVAPIPDWVLESQEFKNRPIGSFFTESYEEAEWYNKQEGMGDGNITFVDVPVGDLEQYRASNNRGKEFSAPGREVTEFFLPKEIASNRSKFIKE